MAQRGTSSIHLPRVADDLRAVTITRLDDDADIASVALHDCDWTAQSARDVTIREVQARNLTLARTHLGRIHLTDVHLEASDLSGAQWEQSRMQRVRLLGCRLTGIQLSGARCVDLLLQECSAEGAIITDGRFSSLRVEKCQLRRSLWEGSDLRGAAFLQCDLTDADFQGSQLAGVDLRGSILDGMRVTVQQLRGAVVDPLQALYVASLLGIEVRESTSR